MTRSAVVHNRFADRIAAGAALAERLGHLAGRSDVLVLALPRGGLPVGLEVAQALHAPLDVLNVRKLGVPWQPELAMGAIATGGICVIDDEVLAASGLSTSMLERVMAHERDELKRREQVYREGRPAPDVHGRTVILVDDGIATGSTMRAAVAALRRQSPAAIVIAVPVAPAVARRDLAPLVDDYVVVLEPERMLAIGRFYATFPQLTDADVHEVMSHATEPATLAGLASPHTGSG